MVFSKKKYRDSIEMMVKCNFQIIMYYELYISMSLYRNFNKLEFYLVKPNFRQKKEDVSLWKASLSKMHFNHSYY